MSTSLGVNATAAAVFDLLQDATFQTAIGGRMVDSQPEDQPRPCGLFTLRAANQSGFGASRGPFQFDLRTHVWSDLGSLSEAQGINDLIVGLLSDATLTIVGFNHCGTVRWEDTPEPMLAELNGISVHEVASNFVVWIEQQ
jgi:hypothetical protein